jgi:NhaP-type Na+/H+ or K+/H+ antiporter
MSRIHQAVARRETDMLFHETERLDRRAGIVLVAFTVAVVSLLVQGGSLAWVVRRRGVPVRRGSREGARRPTGR